jgi:signal transduction histidine kinase
VSVLQQKRSTPSSESAQAIAAQTQRLEGFNRMVSHELRQPLTALQFAIRLVQSSRRIVSGSGISASSIATSRG